jgi:transcriptional regulator with XRE-family HTH domain
MELRLARKIARLTQAELGRRAGVDPTIISRLEAGKRESASYETIVKLARALNVSAEDLFPVPDDPHKGAPV